MGMSLTPIAGKPLSIELPIQKLHEDAVAPSYAHEGDAGLDLCSVEAATLAPFERILVSTGIALAIPQGYAGYVIPRSGLAIKKGLSVVNAPGLIDSGYRGEIKVIVINLDPHAPIEIKSGDRIAQLVIAPVAQAVRAEVSELDDTRRGIGGFGSSGA